MTPAPLGLIGPQPASRALDLLRAAVRPEFAVRVIPADPDDPVVARGRCQVAGCGRGAWPRLLCDAHYGRWRVHGRPDRETYLATAGPVKGRTDHAGAFDLRGMPEQLRLEIAYSIQCRHDDRTVGRCR